MASHYRSDARSALIFRARELHPNRLPRVEAHLHTSWTDGEPTVQKAYQAAVSAGIDAILYSEHSRKTSTGWFGAFATEVRNLTKKPCRAFVGTEVKVELPDGTIDTAPAISDLCDLIIASVHRFPDRNGDAIPFDLIPPDEALEREFELSWSLLGNPLVDILGHMFGMSYRRYRRSPPPDQIRSLIERAAQTGVAVELNAAYHPDPQKLIECCQEFDATITFGSDAHDVTSIGRMVRLLEGTSAE